MIPKTAIERAIEGGWRKGEELHISTYATRPPTVTVGGRTDPSAFLQNATIALDPTFWQALGKASGWKTRSKDTDRIWIGMNLQPVDMWHVQALNFFELILTGGDTTKFWDEILNPN